MAESALPETVVRAACPHDCPDTCAMLVTVRPPATAGGRSVAIAIAGDPEHPTTRGTLCTKVARYLERTYHADRVLTPLKRTGPKGSGRFERIGWDEALDQIARRLGAIAAVDAQRIVPYSYAGTMGLVQGEAMAQRLFNRLGASRLDRTICASAGAEALNYTLGSRLGTDMEQIENSRLIVFWGSNAIASNLHLWSQAQEAKRRDAADRGDPGGSEFGGATRQCFEAERVTLDVVPVEPVFPDQHVHHAQGQGAIRAGHRRDVLMALLGGEAAIWIDRNQSRSAPLGFLRLAPKVKIRSDRVAAPEYDQAAGGEDGIR